MRQQEPREVQQRQAPCAASGLEQPHVSGQAGDQPGQAGDQPGQAGGINLGDQVEKVTVNQQCAFPETKASWCAALARA